jgi:hypothetical protein
MIPFLGIREIPPGSFRKATLSRKNLDFLRVLTLGQSVFDPGVTGSKHMGDTSTRLVRFPTLVVPEQAGHSVASVVTATDGVEGAPTFLPVEPYGTHSGHSTSEAFFTTCNPANENLRK